MVTLRSIDLSLGDRLKDAEYRREWFRAELESAVPDLFRDLREKRGFTQAELAAKADMKQSAVSRFEISSEATWNLETLLRLAEALDAQLSIHLEPAENVIARYAKESAGGAVPPRSVLEASASSARRQYRPIGNSLTELHWFDVPAATESRMLLSSATQKGDCAQCTRLRGATGTRPRTSSETALSGQAPGLSSLYSLVGCVDP